MAFQLESGRRIGPSPPSHPEGLRTRPCRQWAMFLRPGREGMGVERGDYMSSEKRESLEKKDRLKPLAGKGRIELIHFWKSLASRAPVLYY